MHSRVLCSFDRPLSFRSSWKTFDFSCLIVEPRIPPPDAKADGRFRPCRPSFVVLAFEERVEEGLLKMNGVVLEEWRVVPASDEVEELVSRSSFKKSENTAS